MSILPTMPEVYVPAFELLVNGTRLPSVVAKMIVQITVSEHRDPPAQFGIQFYDQDLSLTDPRKGLFIEGAKVQIDLGYAGRLKTVLSLGEISAVTVDFPDAGPPTAHVRGYDLYHRLTRDKRFHVFEGAQSGSGLPDSQVVSQIAAQVDLTPSVTGTPPRKQATVQDHLSDAEFLEQLARRNGYQVWVDGTRLYFKPDRPTHDSVELERGRTLSQFSAEITLADQVDIVVVSGWDPVQKSDFVERVSRSGSDRKVAPAGAQWIARGENGKSAKWIPDAPVTSAKEAKAFATAELSRLAEHLIQGSGTCLGNPSIRVGTPLKLSGIGRFSGTFEVIEATHTFGSAGYLTNFTARRKA